MLNKYSYLAIVLLIAWWTFAPDVKEQREFQHYAENVEDPLTRDEAVKRYFGGSRPKTIYDLLEECADPNSP